MQIGQVLTIDASPEGTEAPTYQITAHRANLADAKLSCNKGGKGVGRTMAWDPGHAGVCVGSHRLLRSIAPIIPIYCHKWVILYRMTKWHTCSQTALWCWTFVKWHLILLALGHHSSKGRYIILVLIWTITRAWHGLGRYFRYREELSVSATLHLGLNEYNMTMFICHFRQWTGLKFQQGNLSILYFQIVFSRLEW